MMWQDGFGHMSGMGWGWTAVGVIHMVVVWFLIALLVIGAVRLTVGRGGDRRDGSTALEVLEQRFARGEIDRQEFEERKAVIQGGSKT